MFVFLLTSLILCGTTLMKNLQKAIFCSFSWATDLCEHRIKQDNREGRYSTRSIVLIRIVRPQA
ncbi:hypothetical protein J6590_089855 [Homalodisca vitripennis]|nr:hypothetical protein J6590_089855 [Homalodisca vitripennis]